MGLSKRIVSALFEKAGVKIDELGEADLMVHDSSFFNEVLFRGSLGFGDSYIEGKWDSDKIDEVVSRVLPRGIYQRFASVYNLARIVSSKFVNLQSRGRAKEVIEKHYDLPSDFYAAFLDPYFQYTCALFEDTDDLAVAQENKMRLICEKLELKKGQRVLYIGGGWGGLARFMSERYEVSPTVVTLSQEQGEHIKKTTKGIEVLIAYYRNIPISDVGLFDAVSVVGFIEHVGHKNYQTSMRIVSDSLKKEGRFLLHTLYTPYSSPRGDPWLNKHIFPNGELSPAELLESNAKEHFHNYQNQHPHFQELTPNYYKTLLAWDNNLSRAIREGRVHIPESERRKWHFYFMSCAGAIKAQHMKVGQFLYQKI